MSVSLPEAAGTVPLEIRAATRTDRVGVRAPRVKASLRRFAALTRLPRVPGGAAGAKSARCRKNGRAEKAQETRKRAPESSPSRRSGPAMSSERTVEAALLRLPTPCWPCDAHNVPIVGVPRDVSEDRMALIDTEMLGAELAHLVSRRLQRTLPCGPIARRTSGTRPEGYWSNGCAKRGAIFGGYFRLSVWSLRAGPAQLR